jgi:sugar phosphate isomerase/epimerase
MTMFPSFNARAVGLSIPAVETIGLAAAAGFAGVDLLVRDLIEAGERPEALRRRMDDFGLVGGAFPLPVNWRGDEAIFRDDLAALPRIADAAAVLGLTRTGTWVMPEIPVGLASKGPEAARRATVAYHVDRLGAIADILGSRGIRVGLEAIGVERFRSGRSPSFVTRLGEVAPILSALSSASAGVGLLLDTFHLYASGESLEDVLTLGVESIAWVHVADLPEGGPTDRSLIEDHDRGLPGACGAIPNREILQILQDRGYRGPVTPEPLQGCRSLQGLDPDAIAQRVNQTMRAVWPRSS